MVGQAVLVIVVAARFLVPLGTPRFPLPAILASLVVDAVDQTVLAAFDVEPDNYQQYDKALDVYYLAIAYISTIRNWVDRTAFRVGQFLWYYRLIGVLVFELTLARPFLLIFPNTFEFFFIFYEATRLRWEPSRLPRRSVIIVAAGIWIFVKLPQEWWIHVAQLDFTEFVRANPVSLLGIAAVAVPAWVWLRRELGKLPPVDWETTFAVDSHDTTVLTRMAAKPSSWWALINHPLLEKTVLVALVSIIFLQWVPRSATDLPRVFMGVTIIILASSLVGYWLCRRNRSWTPTTADLAATSVMNVVVLVIVAVSPANGWPGVQFTLFLLALLTLIVTLYDRYRGFRLSSFEDHQPGSTEPSNA